VVVALPSLLTFSYEDNVAPSLDALQRRLGLSEAELRKVLLLTLTLTLTLTPQPKPQP
jgi:hypothetical protein